MDNFLNFCKLILILQLALLTGCGGSNVPVPAQTSGDGGSNGGSGGNNGGSSGGGGNVDGGTTDPEASVTEIEIVNSSGFTFQPDEGNRADKVIGFMEFSLRDVSNGRFIRDLDNSHMTFKERTLGSEEPFIVEVEATQSSSLEITPIDVMYLIDNSFSVVQSGADEELILQANKLANEINTQNGSSGTVSTTTRFRTFADSVGELQTTNAESPFNPIVFEARGGGTALYEGIQTALMDLSASEQPVLFVFTDGRENASGPGFNLDLILSTATNYDIPVYIAGLGNTDTAVLSEIASSSGGQFFQAQNVEQLSEVFDDILYSIPAEYTVSYRPTQRTGHIEFQFVVEFGEGEDMLVGDFNVDEILDN